jgi:tRNA(Ile)-lysidine synthase
VNWPQVAREELILPAQGEVSLEGGWKLSVTPVDSPAAAVPEALANRDPYRAWMSLDELDSPLTLRSRRRGERFRPLGMAGHSVKISEFMINMKMPARARAGWPLVCARSAGGQEVVWVPGYRLGHAFRLTEKTRRAIALRVWKAG